MRRNAVFGPAAVRVLQELDVTPTKLNAKNMNAPQHHGAVSATDKIANQPRGTSQPGGLFAFFKGAKEKAKVVLPPPSTSQALAALAAADVQLEKTERHLGKQVEALRQEVRGHLGQGRRTQAMRVLKKSKLVEKRLEEIAGQRSNIETQKNALEASVVNRQMLDAQRSAAQVMKQYANEAGIDHANDVMDEIRETIDDADQLATLLAEPLGQSLGDDEELLRDLEAEIAAQDGTPAPVQATAKKPKEKNTPVRIIPPTTKSQTPAITEQEEEELRQLSAVTL